MVKPNSLSRKSGKKTPGRDAKGAKAGASRPRAAETAAVRQAAPGESGDAEKRILAAARREFIAKGQDGARMQVIADEAGVNKALVHYYYRSKDNLYRKVLEETLAMVWGRVRAEFDSQVSAQAASTAATGNSVQAAAGIHRLGVEGIIKTYVSTFVRTLAANRDFPLFVFREIAGGAATFPLVLQELMKNFRDIPAALIRALQEEAKAGLTKPVHPMHFIMNMMGMTVATFLAIPMLQRLGPAAGFKVELDDAFFEARIQSITDTLLNGIRIKR
jgi:TetR/AcrR family transcriptional regulator